MRAIFLAVAIGSLVVPRAAAGVAALDAADPPASIPPPAPPGPALDLPPPSPPPSRCEVGILRPRGDELLYGPIEIEATVECPDGTTPRAITFQVDGRKVGAATAAPWKVPFDVGTSFGPHVIQAILDDAEGRRASATRATPGAPVRESVVVTAVPPDQVALSVSVADRDGRPIRGLGLKDFLVREAGAPQTLLEARPDDRPLSLVVLIDVSSSLRPYWNVLRDAAPAMAKTLRKQDALRVVAFSGPACLVQDFTNDATQVARSMRRFTEWGGGTSLYDTLAAVGTEMAWTRDGRQAVVLVTDGVDTLSRIDPPRLTEYLRRTSLVIETLWVHTPHMPVKVRRAVAHVARETGGSVREVATLPQMQAAFRDLSGRLQDRYYLMWRSDQAGRGGWRDIDIEVRGRDATVLTRRGVINTKPIGEYLIADLRAAEPAGRAKAAEWLGRLPAEGAGEALLAALGDRDARVRAAAAESLGILREPRGVEALMQLLVTPVPGDREAALHGLRVYGPAAVPALLEALSRASPPQQADLITLLGEIGDARGVDAIIAYAQAAPPAYTPGHDAPDLSPLVRHALLERRLAALAALGGMRVTATIPALERAGVDPDRAVRRAALGALQAQATPASFMALDRLARALPGAPAPSPDGVPAAVATPPVTGPPAEARAALIRGLAGLTGAARLGEWLEDPAALDLYLRALRSAGQDHAGPWWPVVDAVGGAPAAVARLDSLAAGMPPESADRVRRIASLLRPSP
ncbi:MAG TPA: VWA domain-containing protein [Dongiaceae bacterium]|nr:VWA domain-containing protein [Dongiaceae bacterium]